MVCLIIRFDTGICTTAQSSIGSPVKVPIGDTAPSLSTPT